LAHKIRGSADILGYAALSEIAASLEQFNLADAGDELEELVNSLLESLRELVQEIPAEQGIAS
jgi:HPt (histidine-containing phosphotransfer) domain-containing protein